jgi:chaperone required for assembly of F1-ATPase
VKHGQKRLYQSVKVTEQTGQHVLLLDGKAVKCANGVQLAHPSSPLMEGIAKEWKAQEETINLHSMPLTRLLIGLLEMDDARAEAMIAEILPYAAGDTLRYHAPMESALEEKQTRLWGKWLHFAETTFGGTWTINYGITPLPASPAIEASVTAWLRLQPPHILLAMYALTLSLTSVIMAAALVTQACTAEEAIELAWLEHDHQMQQWGAEYEMLEKRERLFLEIQSVTMFLDLVGRVTGLEPATSSTTN